MYRCVYICVCVYIYIYIRMYMEREMTTHSSVLAWRIPWTEEHGGVQSMGSQSRSQQLSMHTHKYIFFFCQQEKERQLETLNNTIALISHASKEMLKILQAWLQQYVNCELPDVQAGFRKDRGARDQIANICWIIEKARKFQKNIDFWFIDYAKAFDCVDHNKLWKILKEMGIPDHLTCLLRNLYAAQEATVRTGHGTTDWFQIGKEVRQG